VLNRGGRPRLSGADEVGCALNLNVPVYYNSGIFSWNDALNRKEQRRTRATRQGTMRHFKSAFWIALVVAAAMAVFTWAGQDSILRSILVYPLSPGFTAGLFFSDYGGNMLVGNLTCWIVNSAIYWVLWLIVSFATRKIGSGLTK
jgi:hypothetical protein